MSKNNNTPTVSNIKKNIMGTLSIDLKVKGMRKSQEFIFYPISKETKKIKIQSDTRIALINLDGLGKMSKPHQSGAYFHHLSIDDLTEFEFSKSDWKQIVDYLGLTNGDNVGSNGVKVDNSGVVSIFNLD